MEYQSEMITFIEVLCTTEITFVGIHVLHTAVNHMINRLLHVPASRL